MKQFFSLTAIMLIFILSFSNCNSSGNGKGGECDTIALLRAMLDSYKSDSSHSMISQTIREKFSKLVEDAAPVKSFEAMVPNPIKKATALELHQAYLDNPLNIYAKVNGTTQKIRGFYIPETELNQLDANGTQGARLYFGYDVSTKLYKIIMTSVTGEFGNHLKDDEIFDDFYPCPTRCPETAGATPDAAKTDLNWTGTIFKQFK